jgi:hypothetical protein
VHLPAPSYWPIVLCASFPIIGYGLIFNLGLAVFGGLLALLGVYGIALEPVDDPDAGHGHDGHHDTPGTDPHDAAESPAGDAEKEATLVD